MKNTNLRIKKYAKGWVFEIRKPRWTLFGIRWKWTHCISVSGIHTEPWYYPSKQIAEKEALLNIKWNMQDNHYS